MTTTTETNPQTADVDALLTHSIEMRRHVDRIRELAPNLAEKVESTVRAIAAADQGILTRLTAAKLILNGMADEDAVAIVAREGAKAVRKLAAGKVAMPKSVSDVMEAFGLKL